MAPVMRPPMMMLPAAHMGAGLLLWAVGPAARADPAGPRGDVPPAPGPAAACLVRLGLARGPGGRRPVLGRLVPLGDVDVLDGQAPVVGLAGLEVVGAVNALERGQARDVVVDLLGAGPGAELAQRADQDQPRVVGQRVPF